MKRLRQDLLAIKSTKFDEGRTPALPLSILLHTGVACEVDVVYCSGSIGQWYNDLGREIVESKILMRSVIIRGASMRPKCMS